MDALPTADELRLAYQDTALRRVMGWSFERAMQVPGMVRIVARLAESHRHRAALPTHPSQPRLI